MKETQTMKMPVRFNCQTCQWETYELPLMALGNGTDHDAVAIDQRRAERDGWTTAHWDGR